MKTAIKWKFDISETGPILLNTYRQYIPIYIHISELLIILLLQLPTCISFKYPQMSQVQKKDIKIMCHVSNKYKTLPVLDIYSTVSQIS